MDRPSRLVQDLAPGTLVAIDAMAFIYQLESSPTYRPIVEPLFAALARGRLRAVTSVITLMEIAVLPIRLERSDLADDYEAYLLAYPNLTIVDVDRTNDRALTRPGHPAALDRHLSRNPSMTHSAGYSELGTRTNGRRAV